MVRVTESRPVRRIVPTLRSGELVLTLKPEGVYLREKGRRTSYLLPYGIAFQKAAQLEGERRARERAAARRERAKARRAS